MRFLCICVVAGAVFGLASCRTPSASQTESWTEDGSVAKATARIVDIINKTYGVDSALVRQEKIRGIPPNHPVIVAFAKRLQDEKTTQTETSDYVKSMAGKAEAPATFESYILQEFVVNTNYLEFVDDVQVDLKLTDAATL